MISKRKWLLGLTVLLAGLSMLVACSSSSGPGAESTDNATAVGILVFGDSGYHLDYPDQDDYEDLFSDDEYHEAEWADWLEDKRPRDEYEARPSAVSPVTGKTVPASGINLVSIAMQDFCANKVTCDLGVMLGDNIYPSGATLGADDFDDGDRFQHILSDPFASLVQSPDNYLTYVTLGNHDWETSREGGLAQIEFHENSATFYMDGPFYSVKPPAGNGDVELFIIDTSMLLASVDVFEDYLNDDGSEGVTKIVEPPNYFVTPMTEEELAMPQWLEQSLRESEAKWKIVVAHHPIWSSSGSKFEQAHALRKMILPAMCRYADAYLVGHDHTLEIHTDSCEAALGEATEKPLVQIVSGAAAKQRPVHTTFMRYQDAKYPEHKTIWAKGLLWGFAHIDLSGDTATVRLITVPDSASPGFSIDYEYEFSRRSSLRH